MKARAAELIRKALGWAGDAARGAGRGKRWSLGPALLAAIVLAVVFVGSRFVVGIEPGYAGVELSRLGGQARVLPEGWALVVPGVTRVVRYPLREQVYRSARGGGEVRFKSVEGLAIGADVTVRWSIDPARLRQMAVRLPEDVGRELIEPVIDASIYRVLAQYTIRQAFSSGRAEIERAIEKELRGRLAADGVVIGAVFFGNVELPPEYKQGMQALLAEEMQAEKMRFTLDLKEKEVKEAELVAEAEKVRRDKEAEAAGNQEIIAAKARAEAMKHVLPFKEREIEQRRLEAEAAQVTRLKQAETEAQARRIEANGEADSRRKLAEAEAYRLEVMGKAASEQLAREGTVVSRNPLLIQKALADKLSDKVQVIIAPPQAGFVAAGLLGIKTSPAALSASAAPEPSEDAGDAGDAEPAAPAPRR
ncbi:MAG: SPFH domain-containing protein [Vicinamibacteria bacterium]